MNERDTIDAAGFKLVEGKGLREGWIRKNCGNLWKTGNGALGNFLNWDSAPKKEQIVSVVDGGGEGR